MTAGRLVGAAAVAAALGAFVLAGVATGPTVAGAGGVVLVAGGLVRGSRPVATVGALALGGAVVLAAASGTGDGQVLAAGVAALLAWTFAQAAVDLRASVGSSPARDHELAHVTGTTALVAGAALPLWLVAGVDWGAVPPAAVALLLAGAILLAAAVAR